MEVLIGVPTHKRPELLRACLRSIERQEGDLPQVRVFVADNDPVKKAGAGIVAQLSDKFRFPIGSATIVEPGISAVRNAILNEAQKCGADFIAMIDDDEVASPQWLARLLEQQRRSGADIVGGFVKYEVEGKCCKSISRQFWTDQRPSGITDCLSGANSVLVSASALSVRSWPSFDPRFGLTGGEDAEWFKRLKKLGCSFAWAADSIATESVPPERLTIGWFVKRNLRIGTDQIRIARLHREPQRMATLLCKATAYVLLSPVLAPGLLTFKYRFVVLQKLSRSVGHLIGVTGFGYQEYASRHGAHAKNR